MAATKSFNRFVLFSCLTASLGGLLFGLDQGLMNGALQLITRDLHLTNLESSSFAAILLYGCVLGSLLSGFISHFLGRKLTLLLTALLFVIFGTLSSLSHSLTPLLIFRFMLGVSVGIASFIAPLYLSEIAPTRSRGGFIALYQLMITAGIFLIFISNSIITSLYNSWQIMLYPIIIPAMIMFILTLFIPNTPRWLLLKNQKDKAITILKKIRLTNDEVNTEIKETTECTDKKTKILSLLKNKNFLKVILLGISLQVLDQLTGINSIIYYSTDIFKNAGIVNPAYTTIIIGFINMIMTLVAVRYVDAIGRKPILYMGLTVIVITLVTLGVIFHMETSLPENTLLAYPLRILLVSSVILFIIAFAISAGPVVWILCAELFPLKIRDFGLAITTASNWISAGLIVQATLLVIQNNDGTPNLLGTSHLFFFFAFCCALGLLLIRYFCPETKNVSLEQLEKNLMEGKKLKDIGA